jgi:hypothetical protein
MVDLGLLPTVLKVQFRMHPEISAFSSKCFYNGELTNGIAARDRVIEEKEVRCKSSILSTGSNLYSWIVYGPEQYSHDIHAREG